MKPHPLAPDSSSMDRPHTATGHDMASSLDFARMQRDQYRHDMRNHFDILALHKHDRLKHYGLHFAKYVGRVARSPTDPKELHRTLIDAALVALSTANTLHQDLSVADLGYDRRLDEFGQLRFFADAAGRFADACEKIDHLEDFMTMAKTANSDVMKWIIFIARSEGIDIPGEMRIRRDQLARRQFFIES